MDSLQLRSYLTIRAIERFPEEFHIKAKALSENISEMQEYEAHSQNQSHTHSHTQNNDEKLDQHPVTPEQGL